MPILPRMGDSVFYSCGFFASFPLMESSKKVRLNTFVALSLSFSKTCVMSDIAFLTSASRLN